MNAFLRYDKNPIRLRTRIKLADYSLVVDETLFYEEDPKNYLKENGICIINSQKEQSSSSTKKIINVPANKISQETVGKIFANTVLIGSLAAICKDFKIEMLKEAIKERFKAEAQLLNLKLLEAGYEYMNRLVHV